MILHPTFVLASSSKYREMLLRQMGLPFESHAPELEVGADRGEKPADTALRRAELKARKVARDHGIRQGYIIGGDQVATLDGATILDMPRTVEGTVRQLSVIQDKVLTYFTAVCLLNAESGYVRRDVVMLEAKIRPLSLWDIEHYAKEERPFNCAGSIRLRGRGMALVEYVSGDDPSAADGLPLISLVNLLVGEGYSLSSLIFPDRRRNLA